MDGLTTNALGLGAIAAASATKAMASSAPPKYKKAPDAPKRFKSAFIIFSAEKHKEIKENLAKQGKIEKTTDIAKLVSEAWREMSADEKEGWEQKARKDKARYEVEKALYKGPWKVPANKRTPKDPTAPKRPMSAFLAFSNKRRAGLKREHPDATNADLSKMLSKTWKEAPGELKKKYTDEEAALRATYKVEMGKWRKNAADEKKIERQEREAIAMQAAEARQNDIASGTPSGPNSAALASQYAAATGQAFAGPGGGQDMGAMNPAQMYSNPYANMPGMGGFGGMPADPSQYANMMASGGGFGGQGAFMGAAAQQQILNQLFSQQFKPPMGNLSMYQGFPGQGMAPQQGQQGMLDQQGQQQSGQQGMPQMGMQQGFPGGGYPGMMMTAPQMHMGGMGGGEGQHQNLPNHQGGDNNLGMDHSTQPPQGDQLHEGKSEEL